jgi:hypothetical protein
MADTSLVERAVVRQRRHREYMREYRKTPKYKEQMRRYTRTYRRRQKAILRKYDAFVAAGLTHEEAVAKLAAMSPEELLEEAS